MELLEFFKSQLLSEKKKVSPITLKNYLSDIRHFIQWFERTTGRTISPTDISEDTIQLYKQTQGGAIKYGVVQEGISLRSINRHISSIRKLSTMLVKEKVIEANPFLLQPTTYNLQPDLWHIQDFKDYLYVFGSSHLTIKNYINDIQNFARWFETAVLPTLENPLTKQANFYHINQEVLDGYKKRLLDIQGAAPRTINRKLSSLRRYLEFATKQNLISPQEIILSSVEAKLEAVEPTIALSDIKTKTAAVNEPVSISYSKFAPLRLLQKTLVLPYLLFEEKTAQAIALMITGKKALNTLPLNVAQKTLNAKKVLEFQRKLKLHDLLGIRNIKKEFYAPQAIQLQGSPFHKRIWHHMRHTRPDWYKKYHTYTFSHYLHFAILIVFASGVGIALYQNLVGNKDILPSFAAPVAPPRVLSFQGRLTDNLDNPITTSTNIRFAIYDDASASGAALLWQEVLTSVTPDQDGIFSVILGNGTVIPTTVFSDNINTWLGVTIASTPELTPRQRIATVAYATNSEFLQGLPPITGTAATTNVVLALDASGNLTIGGSAAPTFTASGGQFKLSGQPLVLATNSSSGGNIILIPDGLGKIDLEKPLINLGTTGNISQGAVEIDDKFAVLASESATAAFIVNNQSVGGDIFTASQGGTTKFVIDTNGNVAIGKRTANFTLDVAGTASISSTLSLGPSIQSDAGACAVATAGRMYYDGPANTYYYCNGTSWTQMGSGSGGSSFFRLTNGALSPINDTLDLLIGGVATSTAKIAFTGINTGGTPTASFSGNLSLQVPTGSAPSALFNVLNGGSLNFQTASTGQGDAGLISRLFIANDGRIGINTSSPFTKLALDVRGLTGTTGTASISARSSFASLLVDNAGIGDIIVASQAGRTVLRIDNNGNLIVGANGGGKITADIVDPYLVQNQKTSGITSLTFQTMGASNADFIFQNVSTELSRLTQAGQFQLPITGSTGGIVLGGDAQLFRGAANRIDLSSGDSFNLVSGGLLVGGSTIIDSSGNGTFATLNVTSGCTGCGASGPNSPFQVLSGTIVPVNSTVDFLLGSQATTSAKFAVLNINGSTVPTASVSAQNAGGQALVLGGDGSLQTTRNNTLSLGGSTTGNIALLPRNAGGYVGINTSSPLSTLDVNGTLRVTNTADATDYFTLSSGNTSTTLSRTTNGSILGSVTLDNAGTLTAENVTVSSILNVSSFTGQSGGIIYANASGQVYQAAAGTGTQCLLGGTTPTWGSCSAGGTDSPFTTNLGAIVPGNITQDFLLGAQSTTSAKFAVLNMNGTGPAIASISGNLIVMPQNGSGGNIGIGTINPTKKLTIAGGGLLITPHLSQVGTITEGAGATKLSGIQDVYISRSYAYVTGEDSLSIIDISDPTSPTEIGTITDGAGATELDQPTGVFVVGKYAYVVSYEDAALSIFDVSDPTSPTEVGTIKDGIGATKLYGARKVFVNNGYAYVTSDNEDALSIFDVTNPSSPTEVGTLTSSELDAAYGLYFANGYIYVTSLIDDSLSIIDVTNPASPNILSTIKDGVGATKLDGAISVYVEDDYAYVTGENSLSIIDISNPVSPMEIGTITDGIGATELNSPDEVYVSGKYAYVASTQDDSLTLIDISDPVSPTEAAVIKNGVGAINMNEVHQVFINKNFAYITSTDDTLSVIETSGVNAPSLATNVLSVSGDATLDNNLYISGSTFIDYYASSGAALSIQGANFKTGKILDLSGTFSPTTGGYTSAMDINITHSPTTTNDLFSSFNLTTNDSGTIANSDVLGINNRLNVTSNASNKDIIGIQNYIQNSSNLGDNLNGISSTLDITNSISTGERSATGIYSAVLANGGGDTNANIYLTGGYFHSAYSTDSDNTGATIDVIGLQAFVEGSLTTGGTIGLYGLMISEPNTSTTGNSTAFGIYLEPQTGADNNYGLCFDCDGSWDQNTVGSGIQFGTDANGVNLYRAANDTLRTDDNLSAGGFATISGNLTLEGVGRAVQSTDFNALTLGGTTTGDIILLPKDGIGTVSIPSTSTTGTVLSLAANSLTTGEAVDITTAITTNDTYGQLLDLNLTHTPTDDYGEFSGIDLSNNTSGSYEGTFFGIKNGLSLTGSSTNRNGYGIKNAVSTTSSSGTERLYGIYSSAVGAEDLSGSRNLTAIYGFASASSDGSGGTIVEKSIVGETSFWTTAATSTTVNMSALYALPDAPFILGGSPVVNSYGLNVQWEGFANTTGTTSQYSIYLDVPQGADNNYGICFDCDGTWDEINTTAAGIQFGTDANGVTLYRSASDTLKTDDAFNVAGNINLSSAGVASGLTGLTLASGPITLSASTGTGQCLIGGATASWGACGGGVAGSNWRLSSGALSPINDTLDLLVGSTSSSSAKFAVLNINGTATPVASVSATSGTDINKGIYLSGNGSIQSVRNNTLTIGGSTTGVTQLASQVIQFTGASQIIDTAVAGTLNFNTITNRPITTGTGLLTTGGNLSVNGSTTTLASTVINLTGNSPTIDLTHASTLSINTTTNRPITTGTGLTTLGGNLTVNGSTTSLASTTISLTGASPILNLTHASTLSINTTTNRPITTGTGLLTAGGDLTVAGATTTFSNAAAVLTTGTNLPLTITPNGSGDLILSSDFDTGVYVGASTNTPAALSVTGGIGSNAGFIINRVGLNNDIIAASSAGVTRFVVKNDGTASSAAGFAVDAAAGLQSTRNQTLVLGGSSTGDINIVPRNGSGVLNLQLSSTNGLRMNGTFGAAVTGGNTCISDVVNGIVTGTVACAGGGGGSSNWRITTNTGALSPINNTLDILIGAQATSSAKFSVLNINGSASPFASVSATLASGGSGNGISIGGDGTLQTVRNNTLVLGGTTTGDIWFKPANNLGSLFLTSNGKVNIGTLQSPTGSIFGGKLNVFSNDAGPVASFSGRTSYAALVVDQASGSGDLIAASRSGQNVFRVFNDGTVDVGPAATGKLNAGTVDPPYTIDGQGYATYMPSMVGVKEEYTGKVVLGYDNSVGGYAYKLDFNHFEYQSGHWVFNRIIDPDISNVSVLLSPNSQAKTWYKKDGANRTITLFADRPVEISYRLTAPRFDHDKWKTYTGVIKGHIAPPPTVNGSSANDNNIGADPYYNTLTINRESGQWVLKDVNNNNVNQMEAYGKVFVAQIKSGLVNTRELITDTFQASTASISTLTGNSFNFASGTISSLNSSMSNLGNATASSLNISTENISIAGISLKNYINQTVTQLLASGNFTSPVADSEQIRTNIISPTGNNGTIALNIESNNIKLKNTTTGKVVAQINDNGDASFSGTLSSEVALFESASISGSLATGSLTTNDATISGTLYANNIDGLDTRIANQLQNQQQASLSGNLASGNVDSLHVGNLTADYGIFEQGIVALGPATFTSLTAMEQISIGDSFVIGDNAINTLGADLEIQPLRQGGVNFLAGLVKIDTNGNMDIAGNLNVLGNIAAQNGVFNGILTANSIATNLISPLADNALVIARSPNSVIASGSAAISSDNLLDVRGSLSASGSGTFAKLNFNIVGQAHATSDLEATATGSAGFATLKKNKPELTIYNPNVTEDSLIYITPFGDTQNKVLYLLRQVPDSEFESGSFTVGVSGPVINKDIQFNYLIVN